MSRLYTLMNDFHSAILNGDAAAFAPQINPNPRLSAQAQMNIYIEGYRLRLQEAIESDYPATMALLGQPKFAELTLAFIKATPPDHFNLDHYPYPFAHYIREHDNDPFAADLAMLESAIAEVFLLEESEPLSATAFTSLTPEDFASFILTPRTASRLLQTDFPADTYLIGERKDEAVRRPDAAPSYLYLVRHDNEVKRHTLSRAEYLVLEQLAGRVPVSRALDHVAENYPELLPDIAANIQSWFSSWTMHGFFQSPTE